ncbi:MAG TPA: CBS domain-containing protein [Planctomycetaceae bacterium]|nr:CBS domain-containing protein [Planctomycetaceae bacterium]
MSDVYKLTVGDVMSTDLVTIDAADTVHDALQVMTENGVAALPVLDAEGRCIGMLSTTDFVEMTRDLESGLEALEQEDQLLFGQIVAQLAEGSGHQRVVDVMSDSVITARASDSLVSAASTMLDEGVHRLPVLDEEGRLVGILSTTDILEAFVRGGQS